MFLANGWTFERGTDGSVWIHREHRAASQGEAEGFVVDGDTWSTIVASMSGVTTEALAAGIRLRMRAALRTIAETDPEVGIGPHRDCAYCDSRSVARQALKEVEQLDAALADPGPIESEETS